MKPAAQLDVFDRSPAALAAAYRTAASTALHDYHYTPPERARRARWYEQQAEALEAIAAQDRSAA